MRENEADMTDGTDQIKDFIESELRLLAEKFVRERTAALQGRKISASGELQDSLQYEITRQARAEAVEMLLAFEEHGRFIDMKRLKPPTNFGNPYVTLIEEWIRTRGWEQRFIQKFMATRKLRTIPKNVLNQIAWGIAIKRSNGKYRRRKWYNAPKSAFVSEVFNHIAAGLPDLVSKSVTDAFKEK